MGVGQAARKAVTKGAAGVGLAMCELGADARARWERDAAELSAGGHKVIACAWRGLDARAWSGGELAHGLRLAGLLALEDPVREGGAQAGGRCRAGGGRSAGWTSSPVPRPRRSSRSCARCRRPGTWSR